MNHDTFSTLSTDHYTLLAQKSGISDAVIAARGYRTSTGYSELKSLGIVLPRSADAHGLLLPLHTVEGTPGTWFDVKADRAIPLTIYRPDIPVVREDGRSTKYLYPKSVGMELDCSPYCQPALADPQVPLWLTEGQKKGDALASHGGTAIALLGVWNFRGSNAKGGTMLLSAWQSVALERREIRVVYDSDMMEKRGVHQALDHLVSWLTYKRSRVHVAYLPSADGAKVGADDYLITHSLADLERLLVATGRPRPGTASAIGTRDAGLQDTRPHIRLGPDITRLVDEGHAALSTLPNGPHLFQRARRLSVIARGIPPPHWLHRPQDAPVIVEAQAPYLEELAAVAARWEKYDNRKGEWYEVAPPSRFVKALQARPAWAFPLLEGIIQSPTLRPDGSILDRPGYDVDTGLFFDSNGTTFPSIPPHRTLDHARVAVERLRAVVQDFPFTEPWHGAAWLSAVLSVVCRYTILGCVPMFGITATTRGSGKSLLADTLALIGTGRAASRWAQVFDEEEERKRLFSLALDGDSLVCFDNVTAPLGSGMLALTLTAGSIKDRLLGVSQTKEAPMSAVFLCTGNNVEYLGDMARRVVPIALDPKMERPEERIGFQHTPLLPWVHKDRAALTIAALTIVKAFFDAGCPTQGLTPFGSFEAWSDVIRQALVWCGEADPCEGRKDIEATSNPEFDALDALLQAWEACYATRTVTLAQMCQDIELYTTHTQGEPPNKWHDLEEALRVFDTTYRHGAALDKISVSKNLSRVAGRVIDNVRLASPGKDRTNKKLWRIERLTVR